MYNHNVMTLTGFHTLIKEEEEDNKMLTISSIVLPIPIDKLLSILYLKARKLQQVVCLRLEVSKLAKLYLISTGKRRKWRSSRHTTLESMHMNQPLNPRRQRILSLLSILVRWNGRAPSSKLLYHLSKWRKMTQYWKVWSNGSTLTCNEKIN